MPAVKAAYFLDTAFLISYLKNHIGQSLLLMILVSAVDLTCPLQKMSTSYIIVRRFPLGVNE